jgi:ribosome maturation factor RimP
MITLDDCERLARSLLSALQIAQATPRQQRYLRVASGAVEEALHEIALARRAEEIAARVEKP